MILLMALLVVGLATSASDFTSSSNNSSDKSKAKLGLENTELTPAGAVRAGNDEGTIPEWTNTPITPPSGYQAGTFHDDPFADDKVLFTVNGDNYKYYKDKLTAGQIRMFETYSDFYMNIYQTRRSAVFQPYIYDAALENASTAELVVSDKGIVAFQNARKSWAFPIPQNGNEAWMNQATRPTAPWLHFWETTLAVTSKGTYVENKRNIRKREKWSDPDLSDDEFDPADASLFYYQTVLSPAKYAGQVLLAKDPAHFMDKSRAAWTYNPGQRRVKRAPQIVYDAPLDSTDGLATSDQKWGFNGPNDRFDWKLVGKKEIYVPYNAYKIHDRAATPDKVITDQGRFNQEYARYELHRVWIIESTLKEGTNHQYGRRTFYLDEDSWWIMLVDCYDRRDDLWRYWESHDVMFYDIGFMNTTAEFQYDFNANRMVALMFDKDNPPDVAWRAGDDYFTPANVRRFGLR